MSEKRTLKKEMYYDEAIRLHFELGYGEDRIAEILPVHPDLQFGSVEKGINGSQASRLQKEPAGNSQFPHDCRDVTPWRLYVCFMCVAVGTHRVRPFCAAVGR